MASSCTLVATIGIERVTYIAMEGSGSVEVVVLLLSGTLDDTSIVYTINTTSETASGEQVAMYRSYIKIY